MGLVSNNLQRREEANSGGLRLWVGVTTEKTAAECCFTADDDRELQVDVSFRLVDEN